MYLCTSIFCFFFFFKQKTAYEMRISDWSSDVCSSDLFVMGFAYGPLGGWLPSLFPPGVRYTGTSMSFNLGGIVGGGLAPMIAQALADHGGLGHVGFYLLAAGRLSLLSLAILPRPRNYQPSRTVTNNNGRPASAGRTLLCNGC